jgi:SAM-dependent methyltransferase
MSDDDRNRWNARYAAGAFAARTWPSALLAEWSDRLRPGRALDLACGAGRNALFLARHGWQVDAIDISAVALERAAETARAEGLAVTWIEADLERTRPTGRYDLVVLFRYLDPDLIEALPGLLAPGGWLIVEQHVESDGHQNGPDNPAFRLAAGALGRSLAGRLEVIAASEGEVIDPDGRPMALARLVGRAPGAP